jgi:hypothetical protein
LVTIEASAGKATSIANPTEISTAIMERFISVSLGPLRAVSFEANLP